MSSHASQKFLPVNKLDSETLDKDDRFVRQRCALYLTRLLNARRRMDKETIEFLCWLLGARVDHLVKKVIDLMSPAEIQEEGDSIDDCLHDPADNSSVIATIIKKMDKRRYRLIAKTVLSLLEEKIAHAPQTGRSDIEKKICTLQKLFKLTKVEKEFCTFLFIADYWSGPDCYFNGILECDRYSGRKNLCMALQMTLSDIDGIMAGVLSRTGIIETSRYGMRLSEDFTEYIRTAVPQTFTKNLYRKVTPKAIPLNFHVIAQADTLHVLKLMKARPRSSTHLLLYGCPGSGKSSYAMGIARELDLPTYEIARGDENQTVKRRSGIIACLNTMGAGKEILIIVDEADNLLNTQGAWLERGETQDKGWLNQILEEPGIRIIWITNSIDAIDDAVLRRFSYSLHFKPFNRRQRITLWQNILRENKADTVYGTQDIASLAGSYKVSAGVIDLAVKKAREITAPSRKGFQDAVRQAIEAHLRLMNDGKTPPKKEEIEENYSFEGLNIQGSLSDIMGQLDSFDRYLREPEKPGPRNMNLLFYGPPGTGKSELARYIAKRLDREIICKRVSDILDPYVGMTERRIGESFDEAEREEAILVIDEADSMLFSRDRAIRSWEVSFTNEFLTRMERYRGILICTTNRLIGLDAASIRRFNHKIGFNYLTPEGSMRFYDRLLGNLISDTVSAEIMDALKGISNLTPGDFRIVRDKYSFIPEHQRSHEALFLALQAEANMKTERVNKNTKRVGF